MEHAWRYEISEFQQAGNESQPRYNVAPPSAPKRRLEDVAAVATTWAGRFRSDDGIMLGSDLAKLRQGLRPRHPHPDHDPPKRRGAARPLWRSQSLSIGLISESGALRARPRWPSEGGRGLGGW